MTAHESSPSESEISQAVFLYFQEEQSKNPSYLRELASKLWDQLSPEERAFRRISIAAFFPGDSKSHELAARSQLLNEYVKQQAQQAAQLEAALAKTALLPVFRPIPDAEFSANEYDGDGAAPPVV